MIHDPKDSEQIRERLIAHIQMKTSDTLADNHFVDCKQFQDQSIYEKELEALKRIPLLMKSQVFAPKANSFLTTQMLNVDLLQWTDSVHKTQVFANSCRHRGSKLCLETEGEASHLACPYHSWTYNSSGNLQNAVNDPKANVMKKDLSLRSFDCYSKGNFHWVTLDNKSKYNAETFLSPIINPLEELKVFDSHSVKNFSFEVSANWKLSVASFLETYHFKTVHQKTLGALKHHNINLVDYYKDHLRITVPLNPFFDRIDQTVPSSRTGAFEKSGHRRKEKICLQKSLWQKLLRKENIKPIAPSSSWKLFV